MVFIFNPFPKYVQKKDFDVYVSNVQKNSKKTLILGVVFMAVLLIAFKIILGDSFMYLMGEEYVKLWTYFIVGNLILGIIFILIFLSIAPIDNDKVNKLRSQDGDVIKINGMLIKNSLQFMYWGYIAITIAVMLSPGFLIASQIK